MYNDHKTKEDRISKNETSITIGTIDLIVLILAFAIFILIFHKRIMFGI